MTSQKSVSFCNLSCYNVPSWKQIVTFYYSFVIQLVGIKSRHKLKPELVSANHNSSGYKKGCYQ